MKRGSKMTWTDKIVITRDEVSKRPKVELEGLWNGKDRRMIGRALLKQMRKSANTIIQMHKQADQIQEVAVEGAEHFGLIEKKRLKGLKKYWAAKKLKKIEEEKNDVRGQQKSTK